MWIKRFLKAFQWLWWTIGSIVIGVLLIFALLLNIARIATPWLNKHPQIVLNQIHAYWSGNLSFNTMHWSWSWMSPQVVLNNVAITMPKKGAAAPAEFNAQHLRLALNLIKSIEHMHVILNAVEVHGANIDVRQQNHGFTINGFFIRQKASKKPITLDSILHAFSAVKIGHVIVSKIDVQLFLKNQAPMTVHLPYVQYIHEGHYQAYGTFSITPQAVQTMRFWAKENKDGKDGWLGLQFQHIDVGHIRTWAFVQSYLSHINTKWQPIRRLSTDISGGVWVKLKHDTVNILQAKIQVQHARLVHQGTLKAQALGDLSANIAYRHHAKQWQLSADQMLGTWGGQTYHLGAFQLTHHQQPKDKSSWQFVGNHLWLGVLNHPLVAYLMPNTKEKNLLMHLQPEGWLDYVTVNTAKAGWPFQLKVSGAGWKTYQKIPGMTGFSGVFAGTQYAGVAHMTQQNGIFDYPFVFDKPWTAVHSHIDAHWSYKPGKKPKDALWQILLDKVSLHDNFIHVQTSGSFDGHGPHAPMANLHGQFHLNDVSKVGRYIPIIKITPKLHHWLSSSFSGGFVNHGELIIQGPINKFPFEHHEGNFLAASDMHHVIMHFDPEWPAVDAIDGRLIFKNGGMSVDHALAVLPYVRLSNIQAALPNYKKPQLTVDGGMQGDLKGVSQFLVATPLSVAKVFKDLKGSGDFSGKIHLFLPLKRLSEDTKVNGSITMRDATWDAKAWNSVMTHVNGRIDFTEKGAQAQSITGMMFGSPVTLGIASIPLVGYAMPMTQVQMAGVFSVRTLMQAYVPILTPFVSGQTRISMMLNVYDAAMHHNDQLNLDSNLLGVTVHLPDVLGKLANIKRRMHIHMSIGDVTTKLKAQYGRYLKARSVLQTTSKGEELTSQQVTVGDASIPAGNDKGVAIAVNMPTMSLNKWYALYEKTFAHAPPSEDPLTLTYGSLLLKRASFFHQDLTDIHMVLKQADQQWLWRVMSSRISGVGSMPIHPGMQPWNMQLRYVHLRSFPSSFIQSQKQQAQQSTFMPSQIPQMNVRIKDFSYDKYALHTLDFSINHPTADSVAINNLYLGDSNLHLSFNVLGKNVNDDNPYWQIRGKIQGNNFGHGLKSLGLPVHLDNTQGSIDVNAYVHQRWPVSAWSSLSKVMSATANVHLKNGSITGLSNSLQNALETLKVVNSLSIQSLPARLSNKAKPGSLYFTQLTAAAALYYQKWRLQGLTLSAPDMLITASGVGQIAHHTLDMWVKVEPHLTGSAPVIAAIAFNPIVGIASWFVNKLVVSPLVSKAAGKEYHIFGQWSDIKVKQVNAK